MTDHTITVALVQAEVAPTLDAALERTHALAAEAAAGGAALIAFPETWIPGYPAWLDCCRDAALWDHAPVKAVYADMAANAIVVDGDSGRRLRDVARDVGAAIVVGVVERVEHGAGRGTLYNTLLTIDADGTLLNHHRKLMPTYTERMVWGAGDADGLRAVDIGNSVNAAGAAGSASANDAGVRVGGLICWEHWMPLARHALHVSGEDVHVAVWPTVHERHIVASRHYAFEGRCHVLAVGAVMRASALPAGLEPHPDRVSSPDDFVLRGGSTIIGPDGMFVTQPVYDEAAVIIAELDLRRAREESMTLDVTGHYHRPDLFTFGVDSDTRS